MHNVTFYAESFLGALVAQAALVALPWNRLTPQRKKQQRREPDTPAFLMLSSTFQIIVVVLLFTIIHGDATAAVAAMAIVTVYRCWRLQVRV